MEIPLDEIEIINLSLSDGKYKYSKCYLSLELNVDFKNSLKPKAIVSVQDYSVIIKDHSK